MEQNNQNKNHSENGFSGKKHKKNRYHHKKHHRKPQNQEKSQEAVIEENPLAEEFSEAELDENIAFDDILLSDPSDNKKEDDDDSPKVEVIGIRFKKVGKVYYFAPEGIVAKKGDCVIVDTARGPEFGEVWNANKFVKESDIVPPLRPVIRVATKEDFIHNEENQKKEKEAFNICQKQIEAHGLDMKLVDAQFTFDNSKLLFYFTSSGRVDFRDLVKDLASIFRTRIELRQIGIRDEAKLMGGLGACGRPLCCASFLSDFVQVSIKMAKEQGLSLNSTKISGTCGRLMCCLRYEHDTYAYEISKTPSVDSVVKTEDGVGTVVETYPLAGNIKVKLHDKADQQPKIYHRDTVKIISSARNIEKEEKI